MLSFFHSTLFPGHNAPPEESSGGAFVVFGEKVPAGWPGYFPELLERADVLSLRALRALGDVELDLLVLVQ